MNRFWKIISTTKIVSKAVMECNRSRFSAMLIGFLACSLGCEKPVERDYTEKLVDLSQYAIVYGVNPRTKEERIISDQDQIVLNEIFKSKSDSPPTRQGFYYDLQWRIELKNGLDADTSFDLCAPHHVVTRVRVYDLSQVDYLRMCRIASGVANVELESEEGESETP